MNGSGGPTRFLAAPTGPRAVPPTSVTGVSAVWHGGHAVAVDNGWGVEFVYGPPRAVRGSGKKESRDMEDLRPRSPSWRATSLPRIAEQLVTAAEETGRQLRDSARSAGDRRTAC